MISTVVSDGKQKNKTRLKQLGIIYCQHSSFSLVCGWDNPLICFHMKRGSQKLADGATFNTGEP